MTVQNPDCVCAGGDDGDFPSIFWDKILATLSGKKGIVLNISGFDGHNHGCFHYCNRVDSGGD